MKSHSSKYQVYQEITKPTISPKYASSIVIQQYTNINNNVKSNKVIISRNNKKALKPTKSLVGKLTLPINDIGLIRVKNEIDDIENGIIINRLEQTQSIKQNNYRNDNVKMINLNNNKNQENINDNKSNSKGVLKSKRNSLGLYESIPLQSDENSNPNINCIAVTQRLSDIHNNPNQFLKTSENMITTDNSTITSVSTCNNVNNQIKGNMRNPSKTLNRLNLKKNHSRHQSEISLGDNIIKNKSSKIEEKQDIYGITTVNYQPNIENMKLSAKIDGPECNSNIDNDNSKIEWNYQTHYMKTKFKTKKQNEVNHQIESIENISPKKIKISPATEDEANLIAKEMNQGMYILSEEKYPKLLDNKLKFDNFGDSTKTKKTDNESASDNTANSNEASNIKGDTNLMNMRNEGLKLISVRPFRYNDNNPSLICNKTEHLGRNLSQNNKQKFNSGCENDFGNSNANNININGRKGKYISGSNMSINSNRQNVSQCITENQGYPIERIIEYFPNENSKNLECEESLGFNNNNNNNQANTLTTILSSNNTNLANNCIETIYDNNKESRFSLPPIIPKNNLQRNNYTNININNNQNGSSLSPHNGYTISNMYSKCDDQLFIKIEIEKFSGENSNNISLEIYEGMIKKDEDIDYRLNPRCFSVMQPSLNWLMRAILLDWMMEVCCEFSITRETFYIAIYYIDRYLSIKPNLDKRNLQLLGASAMLLASKMEEIIPRRVRDIAKSADDAYTSTQIIEMELDILKTLKWKITPQTLYNWANFYMAAWDDFIEDPNVMLKASYFFHHYPIKPYFKLPNQQSFMLYRQLIQYLDCVILHWEGCQYKKRSLVASLIYLILGKYYGIFTDSFIYTELIHSSTFLNQEFNGFNQVFSLFLRICFSYDLHELLPIIKFCGLYFRLQVTYDLPVIAKSDCGEMMSGNYEEFLSQQTYNKDILALVKALGNNQQESIMKLDNTSYQNHVYKTFF